MKPLHFMGEVISISLLASTTIFFIANPTNSFANEKPSEYSSTMTCEEAQGSNLTQKYIPGWIIECMTPDKNNKSTLGLAYFNQKLIIVDPNLSKNLQAGVVAHEVGHAWAHDHLSLKNKQEFTQRIGKTGDFEDESEYYHSPTEVWARTWARCADAGTNTPLDSSGTVSCLILKNMGAPQELMKLKY